MVAWVAVLVVFLVVGGAIGTLAIQDRVRRRQRERGRAEEADREDW